MKIVFATGNADKVREIREIFQDLDAEVVTMADEGIEMEIEENGKSFRENAIIKAKAVATRTSAIVMADDSGLVIDALHGEPGIYSARYMGRNTPYSQKNHNLISRLRGVAEEKRTARFVCAIAAVLPDGRVVTTEGKMEGHIGYEEKGENGFGYDPIFYLPEFQCYSAELSPEQKNEISHRGKALRAMRAKLQDLLKAE
jgi:XTP/dITP diphosphohydrolase